MHWSSVVLQHHMPEVKLNLLETPSCTHSHKGAGPFKESLYLGIEVENFFSIPYLWSDHSQGNWYAVKVGFFQKVMAIFSNSSNRHACEPKIVSEFLFPVNVVNTI